MKHYFEPGAIEAYRRRPIMLWLIVGAVGVFALGMLLWGSMGMTLIYTCPVCKAQASLDVIVYAAVDDTDARYLVEYLIKTYQPTLAADTLRYLRLHTPAKQRMGWARVRKVLGEIVEAMRGRKVTRAGRDWSVTVDDWQAAYKAVFDAQEKGTLALPLKDNGYLYAVMVRRVDKTEAIAEAKGEQDKRQGMRPTYSLGIATSVGAALDSAFGAAHLQQMAEAKPAQAQLGGPAPAPQQAPTDTPQSRKMREQIARAKQRRERMLQGKSDDSIHSSEE